MLDFFLIFQSIISISTTGIFFNSFLVVGCRVSFLSNDHIYIFRLNLWIGNIIQFGNFPEFLLSGGKFHFAMFLNKTQFKFYICNKRFSDTFHQKRKTDLFLKSSTDFNFANHRWKRLYHASGHFSSAAITNYLHIHTPQIGCLNIHTMKSSHVHHLMKQMTKLSWYHFSKNKIHQSF